MFFYTFTLIFKYVYIFDKDLGDADDYGFGCRLVSERMPSKRYEQWQERERQRFFQYPDDGILKRAKDTII